MVAEAQSDATRVDRRTILTGAAAAAGVSLLPQPVVAQSPRRGGTLRVAIPFNPGAIEPMTGRNLPDFNVLYAVFDNLIDFDPLTLDLKPGLATAWRWTTPKTLVLDLVEGVSFHDGSPFNAEAVRFNLERYKNDPRSNVKADVSTLERVEVNAPNQLTLHLNRPNAGLPTMLTNRAGCMVSPRSIAEKGPNVDRYPVGSGPFRFVEWQDNSIIKLTRNDNYWKKDQPYLDGLEFRIINELNVLTRSVIGGEADLGINLQVPQKLIADRAGNVIAEAAPSLIFFGVYFNYSRPPLSDVRIRQALNYALDRDAIVRVLMAGIGEPSSTILPKEHWAQDPATANYYNHDIDKAKKLLAEAGYPNGIDIDAFGWADQVAMQRQELIISQWAQAGIRSKLTPLAPQTAIQLYMLEKKGAMFISPAGGFPDPSQYYEVLFGKDALRNAGKVELPGFRELLDATMEVDDRAARKAAFAKLQRFVVEQALQAPQYVMFGVTVRSKRVRNYVDGLLTTPKFHQVWLETGSG
jgi:ABC-type transport system substrate-binding protein